MRISPLCFNPLIDAHGVEIHDGDTVELKPGTRPYRRLHTVQRHRAGFLMFVREDGGYTYHARKTTTGYASKGKFRSHNWHITAA